MLKRPQTTEHATWPHAVSNDLINTVSPGNFLFDALMCQCAGSENRNDVMGILQGFVQIGCCNEVRFDIQLLTDLLGKDNRSIQSLLINIHQSDSTVPEFGVTQNVLDKILSKNHPTRTNDCNICHDGLFLSKISLKFI